MSIILYCTFSICWLCTVYIYIIFRILHIWECALLCMVLHNRMVSRLIISNWFAWFLRCTSWLSSWIRCRIVHDETIFWHSLNQWTIMRVTTCLYYCTAVRTCYLMMLWSFHLNLLKLFMKFKLLLMGCWWETGSIVDISSTRNTTLTYLYGCLLRLLLLLI